MASKILPFENSKEKYIKLAKKRLEESDYSGALSMLFTALGNGNDYEILKEIAFIYSVIEQYEMSNLYWFRYIYYAPKDKVPCAFEELAVNYFYLDNLWASGYYFHKKLSIDGFISKENLDEEIMDFFSGGELKKYAYRVVYPHNLADYSFEYKNAKRLMRTGDFISGIKEFEKVPKECMDEEMLSDLTLAYIMTENGEKAEECARYSIGKFGERVGALCALSTLYETRKDEENAEFYYRKALAVAQGEQEDWCKILSPAIERKDHETAKNCLKHILDERPTELVMRFFYGMAFLNLQEYEKAQEQFKQVFRLNPKDFVVEYYLDLAKKLQNDGALAGKMLPLGYYKELPRSETQKWKRQIKDLEKKPEKISVAIKKAQTKRLFTWGLLFGEDALMRVTVMVLTVADKKYFKEIALNILLNPDAGIEVKKLLIYALVLSGIKGKIGIVAGSYYCDINFKKLLCENKEGSKIYLCAYALCVSRMVFYGIDDFTKMANATDKLFFDLGQEINSAEVNNEELAGLILAQSGYENFLKSSQIKSVFDIDEQKLVKLQEIANIKKENKND